VTSVQEPASAFVVTGFACSVLRKVGKAIRRGRYTCVIYSGKKVKAKERGKEDGGKIRTEGGEGSKNKKKNHKGRREKGKEKEMKNEREK
jgi:hypothetical protein